MKLTREVVDALKAVSETEIRAYAAGKASRIMRIESDGDHWDTSAPMEAATLEALIYGAILAGRYRVTENDLTPDEIIHACADSVCYPVLNWFKERGAY